MQPKRKTGVFSWPFMWLSGAMCMVAVNIFLLLMPEGDAYRYAYDTSEDFLFLFVSLALVSAHSYTATYSKALSLALAAFAFFACVSNLITDYFIKDDVSGFLFAWALSFTVASLYAMRFTLKFQPSFGTLEAGRMYLVVGKPATLLQYPAAFVSGLGGSFAITDGAHIWKFPKETKVLTKIPYDKGFIAGKMLEDIGPDDGSVKADLAEIDGEKWTIFFNCIELHLMAKRFRK